MGGGHTDKHRFGIIKGHVTYSMSPFYQKPFYHYFQNAIPEATKRLKGYAVYAFTPIAIGIWVYTWANAEDEKEHKKHRF